MNLETTHFLTGEELDKKTMLRLLELSSQLKKRPHSHHRHLFKKHIALLFEKESLRTRMSFTVAVHHLGGEVIESISQTRKKEPPKDLIRVLQGYCDGVMLRTSKDSILEEMAEYAHIPIINGLSDTYHPCQTMADLMTLKECYPKNSFDTLRIAYIGDGNNILHSLLLMATQLGIHVHYACPPGQGPSQEVLKKLEKNNTHSLGVSFSTPEEAVKDCHAVYTDVWTSMGFEKKDESIFKGFQVNESLMKLARKEAIFMHCMPMERGKEVSEGLPDSACSVIFQQSENRLHVQKALLIHFVN